MMCLQSDASTLYVQQVLLGGVVLSLDPPKMRRIRAENWHIAYSQLWYNEGLSNNKVACVQQHCELAKFMSPTITVA
jgi:hypothetical protein